MVGFFFKWFVSETPYFIHEDTKAPHITGCGVLLEMDCLQTNINTLEQCYLLCVYTSGAVHLTGILPPCDT